jgi:putative transposase
VLRRSIESGQYTANAFVELCRRHRIVQSMSRSGSCLDNAAAESFFATLKTELVYRVVLATRARARRQLIRWFDRYNQTRRHRHCGWRAPIAYEKIDTPARRAA